MLSVALSEVSVDSITYRILGNDEANIQSFNFHVPAFRPRNSVFFRGNRIRVAHLMSATMAFTVKTVIIPYSINTILTSFFKRTYFDGNSRGLLG
jgi:hypothetical protein